MTPGRAFTKGKERSRCGSRRGEIATPTFLGRLRSLASMQTHDRKVIDVLGDQKRFGVPFYQRHYRWDGRLWLSFWEDVLTKAEEELDCRSKFDHYMGALILAPESFTVAMTPRLQIVDGQQRLTTFQLFLVAMREAGNALGYPEIGEAVRNYLFNQPMSGDLGEEARFKLIPKRADRAIFYTVIGDGMDAVRAGHPAVRPVRLCRRA
jgi:hypothetical protein